MAVSLGSAFISIQARDAGFSRAVRNSSRQIRRQERAFNQLRGSVRNVNRAFTAYRQRVLSLRGAVAALVGGGLLARLIRSQTQFGAQLVENSRQVRFSVETLQLLGRAYQGEGGQIDRFNKALINFSRIIAEADRGLKTYSDQFEILGVSIRDQSGRLRDSEAILFDVADGLAGLESAAQRVNAVYQLFGGRNIAFLNVLQNGSAAVKEQLEAFRELGVVTGQEAERLKALEQSFTDLGNAIRIGAARGVAQAADSFEELNQSLTAEIPDLVRGLVDGVRFLIENLESLKNTALLFAAGAGVKWALSLVNVATAAIRARGALVALRVLALGLAGPAGWAAGAALALGYFALSTRRAEKEVTGLSESMGRLIESSRDQQERIKNLEETIRAYEHRIRLARHRLENTPITLEIRLRARANIGRFENELRDYRRQLEEAREQVEDQAPALPTPRAVPSVAEADPFGSILQDAGQRAAQLQLELELYGRTDAAARRIRVEFEAASQIRRSGTVFDVEIWQQLTETMLRARDAVDEIARRDTATAQAESLRQADRTLSESVGVEQRRLERQRKLQQEILRAGRAGAEPQLAAFQVQEQFAERILELQRRLNDATEARRETVRQQLESVERLAELHRESLETAALINAEETERTELARQRAEIERTAERELKRLAEARAQEQQKVVDILTGGLEKALFEANNLAGVFRGIVASLARIALRRLLLDRAGNFLSGILSAGVGLGGGAAAPVAALRPPRFPGLQGGGHARPGQSYLVGESGPELFRPSVSGTVSPNHDLSRFQGGGGLVVNFFETINIESTDGPGVERALARARPLLEQRAGDIARQVIRTDLSRPSGISRR